MNRVITLSLFLLRDLARSLWIAVPPGLTIALYRVFFLYGSDVSYFASVGAMILGLVCLTTTLLLTSTANRASTYSLLARLPRRAELVAAIALTSLGLTLVHAIFFTALLWLSGQVPLTPLLVLGIAVRWLVWFVFLIAFGLHLTRFISRGGSNLVAYVILILVLISYERLEYPDFALVDTVQQITLALINPLTTILLGASDLLSYMPGLLITLLYAVLLYSLAVWLFRRKDLLWAE